MAVEDGYSEGGNLMDRLIAAFRERYVEEHGEEPSEEVLEAARQKLLLVAGKKERDRNREIYDELAKE